MRRVVHRRVDHGPQKPAGVEGLLHQLADAPGQQRRVDGAIGGAVHQVGDVLALQDLGGVQVAVGWPHVPGQHRLGVGQVVEAVGVGGDEGGHQRVAAGAARAPHPLDVARRSAGHRGEHHQAEVADVDAHLQGGRGSQHVGGSRITTSRGYHGPSCCNRPSILTTALGPYAPPPRAKRRATFLVPGQGPEPLQPMAYRTRLRQ